NWGSETERHNVGAPPSVDANSDPRANRVASELGRLAGDVFKLAVNQNRLFVVIAGNDSAERFGYPAEISAYYGSPFSYAAKFEGPGGIRPLENVLVVESLDAVISNPTEPLPYRWNYTKSDFSNVGGNVSAPGGRILGCVGGNFVLNAGTLHPVPFPD